MKIRQRRRNFLPTLFLAIVSWAIWAWLLLSFPPESFWLIIGFFAFLFLAIFLTTALILANSRRGFLIAIAIVGFLILRYHDLANPLNLFLFLAILLCLEIYLLKR